MRWVPLAFWLPVTPRLIRRWSSPGQDSVILRMVLLP